uniref:Reverse transcriptase domain-containing protein n=1 Tax=Tanacetum cinerariifolium TaxID=118510 RepID=A0A6L2LL94_TANCI|nr:reverse transcriptase domain-containing protein [Tanacetum cinerariifolium]
MNFMVVRSPSPYNDIIGRRRLRKIQAALSTAHGMLKYLVKGGVVTLHSSTIMSAGYNQVTGVIKESPPEEPTTAEGMKVAIHPKYTKQTITIRGGLSKKGRMELCNLLKDNLNVFSWKPADMTGGYHQIQMEMEDEEKTAFRTSQGVFCYTKMPFGLKNARATYQRLVDKAFEKQIGSNLEVADIDGLCNGGELSGMVRVGCMTYFQDHKWYDELTDGVLKDEALMHKARFEDSWEGKLPVNYRANNAYDTQDNQGTKDQHPTHDPPVYQIRRFEMDSMCLGLRKKYNLSFKIDIPPRDKPRMSIRSQVLADFIAERPEEDGSGVGLILTNPEGTKFTYALRFKFETSNNEAEYEARKARLHIADEMGVQNLEVKVDSMLVENQINGSYVAKEQSMVRYLEKARTIINNFRKFSIEQVRRSKNKKADTLSKIASTSFAHLTKQILAEVLKENLIEETEILAVVEEKGHSWMTPLLKYLTDDTLPAEVKKALFVKIKSRQYAIINGVLYRKSFLEPWLRCVDPLQMEYIIREIHEGSCSMHSAQGKVKFLIVAINYFTKWIKAKPVVTITRNQIKKFAWDNIVCKFGLPGEIIADNENHFRENPFKDWCEKPNIKQRFTSVKHPQINGQVERATRSLGDGIKARLGEENKNWVEELSYVLRAHRIETKLSNGHTLFSLTYGTEAVIPMEIGMPSLSYMRPYTSFLKRLDKEASQTSSMKGSTIVKMVSTTTKHKKDKLSMDRLSRMQYQTSHRTAELTLKSDDLKRQEIRRHLLNHFTRLEVDKDANLIQGRLKLAKRGS